MSVHLLKNARVAVATPPQQHTDTTRLLARWCELTALSAAAAAHNHAVEEHQIFVMQQQVEAVLRDRSPKLGEVLDELIGWEAGLIHSSTTLPAARCLICRRASIDAKRLPVQINVGGGL